MFSIHFHGNHSLRVEPVACYSANSPLGRSSWQVTPGLVGERGPHGTHPLLASAPHSPAPSLGEKLSAKACRSLLGNVCSPLAPVKNENQNTYSMRSHTSSHIPPPCAFTPCPGSPSHSLFHPIPCPRFPSKGCPMNEGGPRRLSVHLVWSLHRVGMPIHNSSRVIGK